MRKALLLLVIIALATFPSFAQSKKKIVITMAGTWYSPLGPSEIRELQGAAPGVEIFAPAKADMLKELADADGVIGTINPEMIRAAKKLKWVQALSAGVAPLLTPELVSSDIVLTNCKIVQGPEIADHAMGFLLALTRQLNRAIAERTREEWPTREYRPIELQGKSALVIGVGGIGTQIAVRAHAFGMDVVGIDPKDIPYVPFIRQTVRPDRLDTVLPEADVVFVAAPSTPQTQKMIGPKQFQLMKKGVYFIAVSRGTLYDTDALVAALENKHIAGAGLDVTSPEPLPKGHPLWKFENVIITPHVAGRSDGESARYLALFKENLRRFAAGAPLMHVVDKEKGY